MKKGLYIHIALLPICFFILFGYALFVGSQHDGSPDYNYGPLIVMMGGSAGILIVWTAILIMMLIVQHGREAKLQGFSIEPDSKLTNLIWGLLIALGTILSAAVGMADVGIYSPEKMFFISGLTVAIVFAILGTILRKRSPMFSKGLFIAAVISLPLLLLVAPFF